MKIWSWNVSKDMLPSCTRRSQSLLKKQHMYSGFVVKRPRGDKRMAGQLNLNNADIFVWHEVNPHSVFVACAQ